MKKILLCCLLIKVQLVFAFPKKIEVIFVAPEKVSSLMEMLPKHFAMTSSLFAQNVHCQPVDGGCFHPQLGFIPEKTEKTVPVQPMEDQKLRTINSLDVDMIDCKEGNYFDIFCGKAKKEDVTPPDMEIWVDTSSSMRRIDFSNDQHFCERRTFVETLLRECSKKKINVAIFNTSIKQMGVHDSLCLNHGLNDEGRMKKWIEATKVNHLIIITDVDELSPSYRSFLEEHNAVMRGGDYGDIPAAKLKELALQVGKTCK